MASLLPRARLLGLCFPLVLLACGEPAQSPPSHPPIGSEDLPLPAGARAFSLERENQGPYMERTVERFHAIPSLQDVKSVLWSASGGRLETQGLQATWTLPRAGTASLTLTAETQAGQQLTETFQFRVSAEASSLADGTPANVPLAPVAVDNSKDTTGRTCDLAFDPAGNGHLIYMNDTHPSIWYASWNGTTWTRQQVDGMGFNTGGVVYSPMALTVDASGKPHIVYILDTPGSYDVWYATLSGTTWIRERVSTPSLRPTSSESIGIALDPANGNRPTIAYTWYGNITGLGNVRRTVIAYRTGAAAWTTAMVTFPLSQTYYDQDLRGEILFDPAGTLYLPIYYNAFVTWKPDGTVTAAEFPYSTNFSYDTYSVSLARTPAGRTLMRSGSTLIEILSGGTNPLLAYSISSIEQGTTGIGDLIVVGGKPQEIHIHNGSLELVSPNADNYWVYTDAGSATSSQHIALAQRPTTGTVHYCYQYGSKVMFQ